MKTLLISSLIILAGVGFVVFIAWICRLCEEMFGDEYESDDEDLSGCN